MCYLIFDGEDLEWSAGCIDRAGTFPSQIVPFPTTSRVRAELNILGVFHWDLTSPLPVADPGGGGPQEARPLF